MPPSALRYASSPASRPSREKRGATAHRWDPNETAAAIGIDFFQLFIVLAFLLTESGSRPQSAEAAGRATAISHPEERESQEGNDNA